MMKNRKWVAVSLSAILAGAMMFTSTAEVQASKDGTVYVDNQVSNMSMVSMSTPQSSIVLYAGETWQQITEGVSIRLNVSDSAAGESARAAYVNKAAAVGGSVVKLLDMDLEKYNGGWTSDVATTISPIRIAMSLPATCDTSLDYAVISLKEDGSLEVLGDLDSNPATVTVDSSSFDTFAIIAGAKGAFNKYKVPSATALTAISLPTYIKAVKTTVPASATSAYLYDVGVVTAADSVHVIVGNGASLAVKDCVPGGTAAASMQAAIKAAGGKKYEYYTSVLQNSGKTLTKTAEPIRVTMTVPYDFPAYGDYALAVLNYDGTTTVYKDIDSNDSTITVDMTQFRDFAVVWGTDGTFANCK